jgi:hypothetical protein
VLQPTHQGWVRAPAPQAQHAAPPKSTAPAPVSKAAPKAAPAPTPPPQQHGNGGHPGGQPDQKHVNG